MQVLKLMYAVYVMTDILWLYMQYMRNIMVHTFCCLLSYLVTTSGQVLALNKVLD